MLRHLGIAILLLCGLGSLSQPFRNEWIDFSKSYFKFPVTQTQICRIPKTTLTAAGLGTVPAENFQLWRNGEEIPVYTTQATGPLADDGFIEFYGLQNDGKAENALYLKPEYQPADERSLFSDTSWYYLTQNIGNNSRLIETANNVDGTTLLPDSFYTTTEELLHNSGYSPGYGVIIGGEPIRSSGFDQGEGSVFSVFRQNAPLELNFPNLRVYPKSDPFTVIYTVGGTSMQTKGVMLYMNDSLLGTEQDTAFQQIRHTYTDIPYSRILNDGVKFTFVTDPMADPYDNVVISSLKFTYQRTFNFNSSTLFKFSLPPNPNGNHLRISNFQITNYQPLLYDFTNHKRYTGVLNVDSSLFLLEPSASARDLVLISQNPVYLGTISQLTPVAFTDYTQPGNQAEYIIISNHRINGGGHDYIEDYRAYRSSPEGGGYKARVFDIDDLGDQFAFGQRKNPLAIKNFIRFSVGHFTDTPKYVLLLGKASDYFFSRINFSNSAQPEYLNLVPSWGNPSSDNLLASADNYNSAPLVPIGRVSAINGQEISSYLEKVKQFEQLNASPVFSPENKAWKKEVIQLVGGADTFLSKYLNNFMDNYEKIIADTFVGARVKTYTRVDNPNFANDMLAITARVNNGVGLITYFGHSSSSSIDFNMSSPEEYTNTNGKYPIFIANGCKAGNLFDFNDNRLAYYGQSLSEKYIFSPNRGSIAFISNSDFGVINYLNLFTTNWYKAASWKKYKHSLGEMQQSAVRDALAVTGIEDFFNRQNCEQVILHGDPAVILFPNQKPDYATSTSLVNITPPFASVSEDSLLIKAKFVNLGKSIIDSVWLELKREFPDGSQQLISRERRYNLFVADSISAKTKVRGPFDQGTNYIIATVDPDGEWDEMSENNNTVKIPFEVSDEEIRPVYPYQFAIVNQPGFHLTGSTVNPVEGSRTYRLQLDTTELFNSPLLYSVDTTTIGGAVTFLPPVTWQNGTVYYWRLAPVINGLPVNWRNSSFQYLLGVLPGFGQAHFYQHLKSEFKSIVLDSLSRKFGFGNNVQNLYIVNSIYGKSGDEDTHFSIFVNGRNDIISACVGQSIIFNVFDSLTFTNWVNVPGGRFGSGPYCAPGREYNFEFKYFPDTNRIKIMNFLDSIPKGWFVTARLILDPPYDSGLVQYWKRDTLIFGPGKSLYHSLFNQGFKDLDSLNRPRTCAFVFRKDDSTRFEPLSRFSDGLYDRLNMSVFVPTVDSMGQIISPKFGPAKEWKEMHWLGHQRPDLTTESSAEVQLIGIDATGKETVLKSYLPQQWDNDISDVKASDYPWLRLKLLSKNAVQAVPYQLDYWRLFYTPVPDGALSALDHYVFDKPRFRITEDTLKLQLAFKNISNWPLDSTSAVIKIGDRSGGETIYPLGKLKPLQPGDTAIISFEKTFDIADRYYAYIQVNKEENPVEQEFFNNNTWIPFEVYDPTVPITLVDFTAKAEQAAVRINWNTSNEIAVKSYTLEFGTSSNNLKAIGEWNAKNTGQSLTPYTWLHTKPSLGVNYYRLRITYLSGKVEYSAIRQVFFGKQSLVTVYPNPFHERLQVVSSTNQDWVLELFNAGGQRLITKKGNGTTAINTATLPPGMYMIKLSTGEETTTMKFEKN